MLERLPEILTSLFRGFGLNCSIFLITLAAAIPLGLVITLGSMSKLTPLRGLVKTFVWIIRGTPLMLQIMVVFYAPGLLMDIPMKSRFTAVIIAFIINYAAYFSEIYRGGIESIPHGQYEAGQVLGLTKTQIFFKIVLLQLIKRIIPPMGNELLTLAKDTSLANTIGVAEIIFCAGRLTKEGLIGPLFSTGLFFLAFCGILTLLLNFLEKKLDYYKG